MLKNYLKVAIRHLKRQPGYAALNIVGLTVGIASALLISLYLQYELSFDAQHEKADRIYRISSDIREPDNSFRWAVTQVPMGKVITEEFQEIENYVRFSGGFGGNPQLRYNDQTYTMENFYFVDSTVFNIFTFNFLQGNPETALDAPNSIVLSKTEADKIFKGEDPMGKMLESPNNSYKVTGVYRDMPKTSHIIAGSMASSSTNDFLSTSTNWGGFNIYTYVLLDKNADPALVEKRLNDEIITKYVATIFDQFDIEIKYEMLNIRDIHLYSDFQGEPQPLGNIEYIYIFSAVAIFLVLIACINYMNLATARSMRRSLEVGIRKVMGAVKGALMRQFIVESILIAFLAILLSIIVLAVTIPVINNLLGTQLAFTDLFTAEIGLALLGIMLLTGLVSGSYPAFYLSSFSPIKAIRGGKSSGHSGNVWIRRVLVGVQFAISIFMLIGTLVIYQQMQYVRNADLGFDKDQVVYFSMNQQMSEKWPTLRNKLLENPTIKQAATATTIPGGGFGKNLMNVETNEGVMESYGIDFYQVDYDYMDVLDIEFAKGRNISREYSTDTASAVLVNEAMVTRLGWDEPIGKKFQFGQDSTRFYKVIGVVKNFHQRSMYNPIEALLFIPNLNNGNALVKIDGDLNRGIDHIESAFLELFPNQPFEYQLLDQNFLEAYEEDKLRGNLFLGFSVMMIFISGLGLLGLASFTAEQRTKEISIRKVLGADVTGLITLLVKDFVWLVLIGAIPAFIVGYKLMNSWLSEFEYHINLGVMVFALVLLIVLGFVILTTGWQAYKAATVNPAEKLKYE